MMLLLLEAAARALALGMVTAACLWLLRVKNVAAQRTAWTIVLLGAFMMPALMRSPWIPAPLQWRPAFFMAKPDAAMPPSAYIAPSVTDLRLTTLHPTQTIAPRSVTRNTVVTAPPSWHVSAGWFAVAYGIIAGLLMLRLLVGLTCALRLWHRTVPVRELSTPEIAVRMSSEVFSPVTIGSGVVLPEDFERWTPEKLRAVLAHERAHVRHFDFHVQLLAGIYAAVVWFSPLGWWLRRRLAVLGEAMSDQAAIAEAGTRSNYAEIVLHFAAMPRRPMTGVAMASTGNITRRIEQLLDEDLYQAAFQRERKRAMVAFVAVTFAILASSLVFRVPTARAQAAPPAPPAAASEPSQPAPPAAAPEAPVQPAAAPERPEAPEAAPSAPDDDNVSYNSFDDDGESYALVDGTNTNMTFSGNWKVDNPKGEIEKARRATNGSRFFWFRHDGKSYVVTDPQILAELKALYAPIEALGRQQEELGKQQEALGRQQEALGRRQEQASVATPDLTREINELNAAMKKLQALQGKQTTQEQLADIEAKLGELQGRLGELQGKIGEKQGSVGEEQGKLGEQQGKLGAQQGRLGEQQGKLAQKANKKVKVVIDETLSNGKAKPVQ